MVIIKNDMEFGFSVVNGTGVIYNYEILENNFIRLYSYIETKNKLSSLAFSSNNNHKMWLGCFHKQTPNIHLMIKR